MSNILMIDSTLRDGSHAIHHQLTCEAIASYAKGAEKAGIPILIVGHGNGLGASSLQVGESLLSDEAMLSIAREQLQKTKLGVYMIPGFATIRKDLDKAFQNGVEVVSVGSHCTEVDTTKRYIEYTFSKGKTAYANLMMIHMIPTKRLVEECLKSQSYGAAGVTLMDSAGALMPTDVREKISALKEALDIPIGFHAHNNLGLAIGNSLAAIEAGATIMDSCIQGFGAGAGNAQLEVLVAVLDKLGYSTGIRLYDILDLADHAAKTFIKKIPTTDSLNIISGLSGVFSGFAKHVERISKQYHVDSRDVFFELGKRKVIAGQEDLIIETAANLSSRKKSP